MQLQHRNYDNKSSKVKNKVKLIVLKILLVVVIAAVEACGNSLQ